MIQGLYAAATGIMTVEERQATIANNIANASTVAYKRRCPVQEGFYALFSDHLRQPSYFGKAAGPGGGTRLVETFTDIGPGIMRSTGDPLNLALQGPGYLVVDTPEGERFTRAGVLAINQAGRLTTPEGYAVQSLDGIPIDVRGGRITINVEGLVRVDGVERGRLRLVEFENPHMLEREGYSLHSASEAALRRSAPAATTEVHQECLEMSNVNLSREMIEMTVGLRAYAANQKVMNSVDETMSRLIDQVGSPV